MMLAPLTPSAYRPPRFYGHAWIAAWDNRDAFEQWESEHAPDDFWVLLAPIRVVGSWSAHPGLPKGERPLKGGRAAVLTLGHLKPTRAPAFLRASARAERAALQNSAMSFGAALAWPSLIVSTFSIWDDIEAMRSYVVGAGHGDATSVNTQQPFHRESAFIRYEILVQHGAPPTPASPVNESDDDANALSR